MESFGILSGCRGGYTLIDLFEFMIVPLLVGGNSWIKSLLKVFFLTFFTSFKYWFSITFSISSSFIFFVNVLGSLEISFKTDFFYSLVLIRALFKSGT